MHFIDPVTVAGWPEPNYDHPETRGHGISAVNILLILAIVIFGARCFTRLRISGGMGSDDFLLGVALVPAIGLSATVMTAYRYYGWDRHVWDTRVDQFRPGLQAAFATWIFFALTSAMTKLSLLAFYVRLVPSTSRIYKWSLYVAMAIVIILGFNNVLEVILICTPTRAIWDFVPPRYHPTYQFRCNNRGVVLFQSSINNTIVNFALLLIPIPLVWTQRLFARQRLPLLILFILGTMVCILGALKTGFIVDAYVKSRDQQWAAYPLWVTLLLEVDLGLIVASATAIGPLLARHFPNHFVATSREQIIPDPSMQKAGSGFDRAVSVLTGRHSTRGFVALEPSAEPCTPKYSKTDFDAETSYSAGGQITDEKPNSQFTVVRDLHTGRMVMSPTFPKTAIKSTSERGVTREKVGLKAMLDEDDDLEKGFTDGKSKELEDEGEVAKWTNIGAAM